MLCVACHSERCAQAFVDTGVPHVVAVKVAEKVSDEGARRFAKHFYMALLQGRTVRQAFSIADEAVAAGPSAEVEKQFLLLPLDGDHDKVIFPDLEEGDPIFDAALLPPSPHFNVDRVRDCFQGRNERISRIISYCERDNCQLITIQPNNADLGKGIGKTELAKCFAHYMRQRRFFRATHQVKLDEVKLEAVNENFELGHSPTRPMRPAISAHSSDNLAGQGGGGGRPLTRCLCKLVMDTLTEDDHLSDYQTRMSHGAQDDCYSLRNVRKLLEAYDDNQKVLIIIDGCEGAWQREVFDLVNETTSRLKHVVFLVTSNSSLSESGVRSSCSCPFLCLSRDGSHNDLALWFGYPQAASDNRSTLQQAEKIIQIGPLQPRDVAYIISTDVPRVLHHREMGTNNSMTYDQCIGVLAELPSLRALNGDSCTLLPPTLLSLLVVRSPRAGTLAFAFAYPVSPSAISLSFFAYLPPHAAQATQNASSGFVKGSRT